MYYLMFKNKWLAAMWAGMMLFGIYMTTPREDAVPPVAGIAASAVELGSNSAQFGRARDESLREAELEAFNAGASDAFSGDGYAIDE